MQSAEPETMPEIVPFSQSVMAEGNVEHWLFRIQVHLLGKNFGFKILNFFFSY
jgi:hypothetical protein